MNNRTNVILLGNYTKFNLDTNVKSIALKFSIRSFAPAQVRFG